MFNQIIPISNGYFQLATDSEADASLLRGIKDEVLSLIESKGLYDLYAEVTWGNISSTLLVNPLKVLLNTEDETLVEWILNGFQTQYK
jgi:hypothetical protein